MQTDAPISDYLPDYPGGENITVHHLLTHSSGIPQYLKFIDTNTLDSPRSLREVIDLFRDEPLNFAPGARYSYSSSGYVLLGYLLEEVSGKPLDQFVHERILGPLGMTNTYYGGTEESTGDWAVGYNGDLTEAQPIDFASLHAAAAMVSTVGDLYLWSRALNNGTLLSQGSIDKMFTPWMKSVAYEIFDCGYAWCMPSDRPGRQVVYSSSFPGFVTQIRIYRDDDVVIIILANNRPSRLAPIPKIWTASEIMASMALYDAP